MFCFYFETTARHATLIFSDAVVEEEEAAPAEPAFKRSTALPFLEYPPNLAGYTGDAGFDPLRFSDFANMDFLREAEIKHGRICMLATVGFAAVDLGLRVYPTPTGWEDLTSVTAHDALLSEGAMGQLFLWIGLVESLSMISVMQMVWEGSGRRPGDFGLDPLGFISGPGITAEQKEDMYLKELTHCRLAMLAFSGMVTQAVLTQGPFPYV